MKISSEKVQWLLDDITEWAFKNLFNPIQQEISGLIIKIKNFFESKTIRRIDKFIKFVVSGVSTVAVIYNRIIVINNKLQIFIKSVSNRVLFILIIVDYRTGWFAIGKNLRIELIILSMLGIIKIKI